MQWASAISSSVRLEDAAHEAAETVARELAAPADVVFAFFHREYGDHVSQLAPALAEILPDATLIGCSAGGVIGAGEEIEGDPALSLAAGHLPGAHITPFHLGDDDWDDTLCGLPADADLALLADPFTVREHDLIAALDARFPSSVKVGGLCSGGFAPGESALVLGDQVHRTGTIGVALSGNIEVDAIVSQGCRPIGQPLFVTRANGHQIIELDKRPALEVVESLFAELAPEDQAKFRNALFVGLAMQPDQAELGPGDFLIRHLVGVDATTRALTVAADMDDQPVVQFHLRDADTSSEDLDQLLTRHQYSNPAGALLFSCAGRGAGLYGMPNHDSGMFTEKFGDVALAGFFGSGELGPVAGKTFLHTYTSAFALFREK